MMLKVIYFKNLFKRVPVHILYREMIGCFDIQFVCHGLISEMIEDSIVCFERAI